MRIPRRTRFLSLLLVLVAWPSIASAEAFCDLTLTGGDTLPAWSVPIIHFEHELEAPRDTAASPDSKEPGHGRFMTTKPIDKSSPELMEAFAAGRTLPGRVLIDCETETAEGEQQYYTIELVNASIASIRVEMNNNEATGAILVEEIGFTYDAIEHHAPGRQGGHMTVFHDYR